MLTERRRGRLLTTLVNPVAQTWTRVTLARTHEALAMDARMAANSLTQLYACPYCTPSAALINCGSPCPDCERIRSLHQRAETDERAEAESQRWIAEHAKDFRNQAKCEATKL